MGNRVPKSQLLECQTANETLNTSYNTILDYYTIPNNNNTLFRVLMGTRSRLGRFITWYTETSGKPNVIAQDGAIHVVTITSAIAGAPYVLTNTDVRLQFIANTFVRFVNQVFKFVVLFADGLATDPDTIFQLRPVKYDDQTDKVVTPQPGSSMTFDELVDTDVRRVNVNEAYLLYNPSSDRYIGIDRYSSGEDNLVASAPNDQVSQEDYLDYYWDLTFNQYTSRSKQINPNAFAYRKYSY